MDLIGSITERSLAHLPKDLSLLFQEGTPHIENCPETLDFRFTHIGHVLSKYPVEAQTQTKAFKVLAQKNLLFKGSVSIPPDHVDDVEHLLIAQLRGKQLGKDYWSWGIKRVPSVIDFAERHDIHDGNILTIHNHLGGSEMFSNGDYSTYYTFDRGTSLHLIHTHSGYRLMIPTMEAYNDRTGITRAINGDFEEPVDDMGSFLNRQWQQLKNQYNTSSFVGTKTSSNSEMGNAGFPEEVNDAGVDLLQAAYGIYVSEFLHFPQYMSDSKNPLHFNRINSIIDIFPSLRE